MGLSSKEVSTDGFDWGSQSLLKNADLDNPKPPPATQRRPPAMQQGSAAAAPPLRCPRCNSNNTKFCYYNNYSRSQPRHFCKACKRHWTNGGTLRNVPVGGGRKSNSNKRSKTTHHHHSKTVTADNPETAAANRAGGMPLPNIIPQQQHLLPLPDVLCQALLQTPMPPWDYGDIDINGGGSYLGSLLSLPVAPHIDGGGGGGFPFSTSTSSSPPCFFDFTGQEGLVSEEVAGVMEAPWQMLLPPPCSSGSNTTTTSGSSLTLLESSPSPGYWGTSWDDLSGFLSPDLKHLPPPSLSPSDQLP